MDTERSIPGGQKQTQMLHKVHGSVEVARNLIDRSVDIYGRNTTPDELTVLLSLIDAADALAAAVGAIEELGSGRSDKLGPAA